MAQVGLGQQKRESDTTNARGREKEGSQIINKKPGSWIAETRV
jgi:hypothetical protein